MTKTEVIKRAEAASRRSRLAGWRAAVAAGMSLAIVDAGVRAMAAGREVPGRAYNRAMGLEPDPNLLPQLIEFFGQAGSQGWAELDESTALKVGFNPSAIAAADRSGLFAAEPARVSPGADVPGVTIREVFADEVGRWVEGAIAADSPGPSRDAWLRRIGPHLLGTPEQAGRRLFAAEVAREFVGVGALFSHGRIGWLTAGAVRPDFRRRGIQRALIGSRATAAARAGCTHVASDALIGEGSDRNLVHAGLAQIATRIVIPVPLRGELRPRA